MAIESTASTIGYSPEEQSLAKRLIEENYDVLISVARAKRRRARLGESLATVDLLHEGFLKVGGQRDWHSNEHFVRAVVLAMRHVIVDHARRRSAEKRGGGVRPVSLDLVEPVLPEFSESPEELVAIGELLTKLGELNPRWLHVVDARYFGGMTESEAAEVLGVSERTIRRDWADARDWIADQLGVKRS